MRSAVSEEIHPKQTDRQTDTETNSRRNMLHYHEKIIIRALCVPTKMHKMTELTTTPDLRYVQLPLNT